MNLGDVYLKTFFNISAVAVLIAITVPTTLRLYKRIHLGWLFVMFLILSILLIFAGNSVFHHDLFVARHLKQNEWVPQQGCTSYEPSFRHLFASYTMTRDEFESWATSHPWQLRPYNSDPLDHDSARLGFTEPDAAYATEMAGNGSQLRVYFKDGTMFLSYNVM